MSDKQSNQSTHTYFKKEDAYCTLEMINTWINNIDTKVSFAIAILGVMIGFIFGKGTPKAFINIGKASRLIEVNGGELIGALLVCGLYILSFISIICLIFAILARVKNDSELKSIFFFGTIASMKLIEYCNKLNSMSEEELLKDLAQQIYINSQICTKKIKYYNIGIKFLVVTTILWFICSVFQLI